MRILTVLIALSFIFVSWFFYVEDRFLFKVKGLRVSDNTLHVQSGDILRLGISTDGSVASHWLGRPLHHYALVLSIDGVLYVAHTWYKKLTTNGNIHIPPSYQLQPMKQYIEHSKLQLVEVFRHPLITHKDYTLDHIIEVFRSIGSNVRCYITIMNLLDVLYPELHIVYGFTGRRMLRNNTWWSFFCLKPLYFEQGILAGGFKYYNIMYLKNLINESLISDYYSRSGQHYAV